MDFLITYNDMLNSVCNDSTIKELVAATNLITKDSNSYIYNLKNETIDINDKIFFRSLDIENETIDIRDYMDKSTFINNSKILYMDDKALDNDISIVSYFYPVESSIEKGNIKSVSILVFDNTIKDNEDKMFDLYYTIVNNSIVRYLLNKNIPLDIATTVPYSTDNELFYSNNTFLFNYYFTLYKTLDRFLNLKYDDFDKYIKKCILFNEDSKIELIKEIYKLAIETTTTERDKEDLIIRIYDEF